MKNKQLANTQALPISLHIKELRNRLAWVVLFFMAGAVVGYINQTSIIELLRHYMVGSLYYTSPAGNFNFIMKISLMTGAVAVIPILTYQLIKFTQPALSARNQYRRVWVLTIMSLILALAGMAFAMWIVIPMSLHFFAGFSVNGVQPLISADEYLNFVIKALTWFAVLFQIPLLMLFINKVRPLKPKKLLKYEKHVVIGALIIALILPFTYDPITQFVIAIPIVALYNLSVLFVWLANRKSANAYDADVAKRYIVPSEQVIIVERPKQLEAPEYQELPQVTNIRARQPLVSHQRQTFISDFGKVRKPSVSTAAHLKRGINDALVASDINRQRVFSDVIAPNT